MILILVLGGFLINGLLSINSVLPIRVTLPTGIVEGYTKQSILRRTFYAFEGIPYARAPVGKYRFQKAVPPKNWTGVWHAKTIFKCMQYEHYAIPGKDRVTGDEDCLYVNVYSPNLNGTEKLDVVVYIHGGAFMFNFGGLYGPEILMDRDIVYVNFNYRLGPLGFLSTEDDVVPGNNGLRDQILALKWVKNNIEYFGGNTESITLLGNSAGGASVQFHYLFPESQGLFHRGISQSGSVLNGWVLMEKPLEKAKKVSTLVGCSTDNLQEMVDCLRTRPGKQITNTVEKFQPWLYNPFSPFGVVVDDWASDPLIPEQPYKLLTSKTVRDLPWFISYVSSEGLYPGSDFYHDIHLEHLEKHWNEIIPYILHYNDVLPEDALNDVSQKIRQEYLKEQKITKDTYKFLIKAISDRLFIADIEKSGRLHSAAVKSPVYSYYFDYRGVHSKTELRTHSDVDIGVSHADDTLYIMKTGIDTLSTEEDRNMSKLMVDMIVSFMKTGTPNVTSAWEPLSKNLMDAWIQLHISNAKEIYVEKINSELGNRKFWDSLQFEENENLLSTKDEL